MGHGTVADRYKLRIRCEIKGGQDSEYFRRVFGNTIRNLKIDSHISHYTVQPSTLEVPNNHVVCLLIVKIIHISTNHYFDFLLIFIDIKSITNEQHLLSFLAGFRIGILLELHMLNRS